MLRSLIVGFALATAAFAQDGTLTGRVTFSGTVPAPESVDLAADPVCHADEHAPKEIQTVLVRDGGLKDVFVWVTENVPDGKYKAPDEPVVLDQIGCHYEPHVFGIIARQDIEIRNSDDTLHNIHAMPESNKEFNVGMPNKGMKIEKTFKKDEEAIHIKCDVHPWMSAYCFSMEHPFFAVTDADGAFEIAGLPDGEYGLTAWHETLGRLTGTATVADGRGDASFEFASE